MSNCYDWLVIGGGFTGSVLAYELQKQGWKTALLEPNSNLENATRYSYGGLPFWFGKSPEMRELCAEGIKIHRQLSDILDSDTEFREINLLLTIRKEDSPDVILEQYQDCEIPPQLLSVEESCELEPLLNPSAIAASICFPHGHIHPQKTNQAYLQTFTRLGGNIHYETAIGFQIESEQVVGVSTAKNHYPAKNTVICAGGLTRSLLREIGVSIPIYFTHAELLETPPLDLKLNSLIMPSNDQRLGLEETATAPEKETLWDQPGEQLASAIIDPGAIQFGDQHFCLGQISRTLSDPNAEVDPVASELWLREEIGHLLPRLKDVPAQWHRCLIAFSPNRQSLMGKLDHYEGIYLFSGFTSPLLLAPPLAQKFVQLANQ